MRVDIGRWNAWATSVGDSLRVERERDGRGSSFGDRPFERFVCSSECTKPCEVSTIRGHSTFQNVGVFSYAVTVTAHSRHMAIL